MEDSTLDYEENKGMPVFLKVLCILTFIGAGLGILMSIYSMFTVEQSIKSLEQSSKLMGSSSPFGDLSGQIEATRQYGLLSAILSFVGNSICLLGAFMMWKLKRMGYFIYITGHIFPIVGSILYATASGEGSGFMSSMTYVGVVIQFIFSGAFIIMYGVNLKHLKN